MLQASADFVALETGEVISAKELLIVKESCTAEQDPISVRRAGPDDRTFMAFRDNLKAYDNVAAIPRTLAQLARVLRGTGRRRLRVSKSATLSAEQRKSFLHEGVSDLIAAKVMTNIENGEEPWQSTLYLVRVELPERVFTIDIPLMPTEEGQDLLAKLVARQILGHDRFSIMKKEVS